MAVVSAGLEHLGRIRRWWCVDIWSSPRLAPDMPLMGRLLTIAARSLYIVATGFRTERIKLRAAHLTYVTLLSIVPALVVVFSLFTAFTGLEGVQASMKRFVVDAIAVTHQDTLERYLDRFVSQAGTVGGFGVVALLFTVITLIGNIERAFNDIWGIGRDRSLIQRFQVYWPLITLGPILVGLSLSLTAAAAASSMVRQLVALMPIVNVAVNFVPVVLTWGFLTLLYVFLPNTRVPFRAALVGGVVAGTLWEVAKRLYALYAEQTLTSPSVYGSLAAVPLFILWMYVSWVVALLGATLTFAVQNARSFEPEEGDRRRKSQRERELLAARLVAAISDVFDRGAGPMPSGKLLDSVNVPPRFAQQVLEELVEERLIVETQNGGERAFVPGRPIAMISMADIVRAMRQVGARPEAVASIAHDDVLGQRVQEVMSSGESALDGALGGVSLLDVVTRAREAVKAS